MIGSNIAVILTFALSLPVLALDSSDVLPAHVNSSSTRIGLISGIGERYSSNGSLVSLTDLNSITFDSKKLVSIEPRVQQLISVLNQFGQQGIGSELSLGTLHIGITPQLNYLAPIQAYGITDKWTIAVGVPIIHYKNKIALTQEGSNLASIQKNARGLTPELDSAFNQLSVGLVQSAQKELSDKGYKTLQDVDSTFVGDMQLVSLYQLFHNRRVALLTKTVLNLPTGPKDDPDDLTDLAQFGQTSLSQGFVLTYMLRPRLRLSATTALQYTFTDQIQKRVPTSADDTLPEASTKETVSQQIGPALTIGTSTMYWLTQRWSAGAGFEVMTKAADTYQGSNGRRYDLLATETNAVAENVRFGVTYDTISAYLAKSAWIPGMIAYTYADTIAGINIAHETVHELWFTMFF